MFAYCANNPVLFSDWSGTKVYTSPWEDQTDSNTGSVTAMMAALGYYKEPTYEDVILNDCHAGVSTESFSKSGSGRIGGPLFSSTTYDYKLYTVDRNPPGATVIHVRTLFPYRNIFQYFKSYSGKTVNICGHLIEAHGKVTVYVGFENGTMVCVELLHFVTKESNLIKGVEQELEGYMTNASSLGEACFAGTGCGGGYNGFLRIDR